MIIVELSLSIRFIYDLPYAAAAASWGFFYDNRVTLQLAFFFYFSSDLMVLHYL